MTRLPAADVAHLEPGMPATIRFDKIPHPVTSVLYGSHAARRTIDKLTQRRTRP